MHMYSVHSKFDNDNDYTELWTKRTSNHTNKKIEKNKIKGKGCPKENGRKKKKKFDL